MSMEDPIAQAWSDLYTSNPKIKAFALLKGSSVTWQTSNWNLVNEADVLSSILKSPADTLRIGDVEYHRVHVDDTSFVATADGDGGHLLMSLIDVGTWLVAWAAPEADPELAQIDLAKTALDLREKV